MATQKKTWERWSEKEEALAKQEEGDIERTANEAEARLEEMRGLIQANLWSKYGQYELITAIEEASEQAGNVPVEGTNLEGYGVFLTLLWGFHTNAVPGPVRS